MQASSKPSSKTSIQTEEAKTGLLMKIWIQFANNGPKGSLQSEDLENVDDVDNLKKVIKARFPATVGGADFAALAVKLGPEQGAEVLEPSMPLCVLSTFKLQREKWDGNPILFVEVPLSPKPARSPGVSGDNLVEHPLHEPVALDGSVSPVLIQQKTLAGFLQDSSWVCVRPETTECWAVLEQGVKEHYNISLEGPPGTGKSTIAWAWACCQAYHHGKTVIWFHFHDCKKSVKVILDGKRKCVLTGSVVGKFEDIEEESIADILVVDGVTEAFLTPISQACSSWQERGLYSGMFVLVSSNAPAVALEKNLEARIRVHNVPSWTFEDDCKL